MPKKISRNDPCPCGSGKKYKQCLRKGIEYGQTETGQIVRRVQLNDEVVEALDDIGGDSWNGMRTGLNTSSRTLRTRK